MVLHTRGIPVSASVVKELELGRGPELYGETSRKVNALLSFKKTFFSQQKISNSFKMKLVADLIPNALCLTWKWFQQHFDLHPKATGNSTNCSNRPKTRKERTPTLKKKKKGILVPRPPPESPCTQADSQALGNASVQNQQYPLEGPVLLGIFPFSF